VKSLVDRPELAQLPFCRTLSRSNSSQLRCLFLNRAFRCPASEPTHVPTEKDAGEVLVSRALTWDPLRRADTTGGCGVSHRHQLKKSISSRAIKPVSIDEGQTGSVFALESDGKKVAVFKPSLGEAFERYGFHAGDGAIREEAVYLVDRLCGQQARVPVTTRAWI